MARMVDRFCELCGSLFRAKCIEINRGKARFCGRVCANTFISRLRGSPKAYKKTPEFRRTDPYAKAQRLAGHKVSRAIASGKLIPEPCEKCGNPNAEAHHDDYRLPLSVRWLCRSHHNLHHSEHGEALF